MCLRRRWHAAPGGGCCGEPGPDAMSREEELAKLKQQAADFQSQGVGGPSRVAGPLSARLQLTESDSEFMRQLAQLKEDHVANLRVIERMYNEGQGGGGSALPDYDDGGASVLHGRVVRAVVPRHSHARSRHVPDTLACWAAARSGAWASRRRGAFSAGSAQPPPSSCLSPPLAALTLRRPARRLRRAHGRRAPPRASRRGLRGARRRAGAARRRRAQSGRRRLHTRRRAAAQLRAPSGRGPSG